MSLFCKAFRRYLVEEDEVEDQMNRFLNDHPELELISVQYAPRTPDTWCEVLMAVLKQTDKNVQPTISTGVLTIASPVITNYDMIRGFSLDEMAEFFNEGADNCSRCILAHINECASAHSTCLSEIRDWLMRPAKEEEK